MPKTDKNNPQPNVIANPFELLRDKDLTWADPKNLSHEEARRFLCLAEHSMIARGFDPNQVVKMGIAIRVMLGDSK